MADIIRQADFPPSGGFFDREGYFVAFDVFGKVVKGVRRGVAVVDDDGNSLRDAAVRVETRCLDRSHPVVFEQPLDRLVGNEHLLVVGGVGNDAGCRRREDEALAVVPVVGDDVRFAVVGVTVHHRFRTGLGHHVDDRASVGPFPLGAGHDGDDSLGVKEVLDEPIRYPHIVCLGAVAALVVETPGVFEALVAVAVLDDLAIGRRLRVPLPRLHHRLARAAVLGRGVGRRRRRSIRRGVRWRVRRSIGHRITRPAATTTAATVTTSFGRRWSGCGCVFLRRRIGRRLRDRRRRRARRWLCGFQLRGCWYRQRCIPFHLGVYKGSRRGYTKQ